MADEGKIRVERFNGVNFGSGSEDAELQIEDYLYQKDLFLSIERPISQRRYPMASWRF